MEEGETVIMMTWILIAAIGGVLSYAGLMVLYRKYHRGEITKRYFLAIAVGFCSFVLYALVSALRPDFAAGLASVVMLLLAFIAIVVVIREHERAKNAGVSRD